LGADDDVPAAVAETTDGTDVKAVAPAEQNDVLAVASEMAETADDTFAITLNVITMKQQLLFNNNNNNNNNNNIHHHQISTTLSHP
jgi:hypothetical protein